MYISISQDCIYKHFVSVDHLAGIPYTSSYQDAWENFAIENHQERDGGISFMQATDNTLIVLTTTAWNKLVKNQLFSCSQDMYYAKVADPTSTLRLALERRYVKGSIDTTRGWTGYSVTDIRYSGRAFAFDANFTANGFEVNHFVAT
jgi:hypothetical protein